MPDDVDQKAQPKVKIVLLAHPFQRCLDLRRLKGRSTTWEGEYASLGIALGLRDLDVESC
jgi:hypothetical protein